MKKLRRAMTLVELLVVIAVIAALSGILLPAIQAAREASRRTVCFNNARQVAMAALNYSASSNGTLPAMWQSQNTAPWDNFSWRTALLPHLEQQTTYDQLDLKVSPIDDTNRSAVAQHVEVFQCPSSPNAPRQVQQLGVDDIMNENLTAGAHDLVAVHAVRGPGATYSGIWNGHRSVPYLTGIGYVELTRATAIQRSKPGKLRHAADGLSKTALLVEQAGKPVGRGTNPEAADHPPSEGAWATCDFGNFLALGVNTHNYYDPFGFHGGAVVAMGDGSVMLMPESISAKIISAVLSRDGSEIISVTDWQ